VDMILKFFNMACLVLCSIGFLLDSYSILLIGEEQKAPSAILTAEWYMVLILLIFDLGTIPYRNNPKSIFDMIIEFITSKMVETSAAETFYNI